MLSHPNVLEMKDSFLTYEGEEEYLNIIMEYYSDNLYQVIKKKEITPINMKLYAYQIFRALNYLSMLSISHRDMKPQNILVDMTKNKAIICDFGSAKKLVKSNSPFIFSWGQLGLYMFPMLQGSRTHLRSHQLQLPNRYVVHGLHPRRNGQRASTFPRRLPNRPTHRNHQGPRNPHPRRCWGNESQVWHERIHKIPQNQSNSLEKRIFTLTLASQDQRSITFGPHHSHLTVFPSQKNHSSRSHRPWLLWWLEGRI